MSKQEASKVNVFGPCPESMNQGVQRPGPIERIDYFEDCSVEELQQITDERSKTGNEQEEGVFVILDEGSARDKTAIVWYLNYEFNDVDELIGSHCVFQRVRFHGSYILIALNETKEEFYDTVFSKWDRFVGEDGIFPVKDAMKQIEHQNRMADRRELDSLI